MANQTLSKRVVAFVREQLESHADSAKAVEMAAYMKTTMPFYGVQKPQRVPILRSLKKEFRPSDLSEYQDSVLALWKQKHREEKYCAINYASMFSQFIVLDSLPLYEEMIRSGSWWDFVDPISADLVGTLLLDERKRMTPVMRRWSKDSDFWIRRASLLSHLHHKSETDESLLYESCLLLADETEFFIRKGMGWALREYSKSNPKSVRAFVQKNKNKFSSLTLREASKYI